MTTPSDNVQRMTLPQSKASLRKNPYTRASLERALVHHGVRYTPPDPPMRSWLIETHLGLQRMTTSEVYCFVMGLAHKEQALAKAENRRSLDSGGEGQSTDRTPLQVGRDTPRHPDLHPLS